MLQRDGYANNLVKGRKCRSIIQELFLQVFLKHILYVKHSITDIV